LSWTHLLQAICVNHPTAAPRRLWLWVHVVAAVSHGMFDR
jgi:hypothetical protein